MKITKIEAQRRIDRVNIYIDEKFAFGLDDFLRYKYNLSSGMEISQDFIDDILEAEEKNRVINHALKLLSYRQRSEMEMYNKLREKGYDEEHIDNAIQYCKDKNYIDDRSFAEVFTRDKINLNKHGPQRIKYELISKGVSKDIIEEVLEHTHEDEFQMAMNLALKRLPRYKDDEKPAIYRKLGGFLQRKGYSYNVVKKVLNQVLDR